MVRGTMSLDTTLADITARLRENGFPNEQAISQGIVLRLLRELGWDTYDTVIVWPEYQTGGGRADFALCHPPSKPAIFIEVKHVGRAEGAVQQALQYAFHCGVPFVVLTDGRSWSFYLPAEQGDYDERRVYMLDLYERSAGEAAETFRRYLARENVASGKSLGAARTEYRNRNRRSQAKAAIPEAWRELVQKRDVRLLESLADAVASKVGFPPDADDVVAFLGGVATPGSTEPVTVRSLSSRNTAPWPAKAKDAKLTPEQLAERRTAAAKKAAATRRERRLVDSRHNTALEVVERRARTLSQQLVIRGEKYDCPTAKDAMVTVLRRLADSDPSFLERCARHADARGRKRRYIARTPEELYPDREDLRDFHEKLPGGWLVSTNLNNDLKRKIIDLAAETAGLRPREDIVLPF